MRDGADADSRVAIGVLGMHRSGTSALARVLSLIGADLPSDLMPARTGNEPGHWEPRRIVELNDELLASASSSWDDVSAFPAGWYGSPPEAELRRRAVELLAEEYRGSRLFVVKDPRICRIVPFWVSVLAEFGASPSFVLPIRNPLEVAASLRERDEFSVAKGLLLWLQHTLAAERDTRSYPRVFVSYDRLLKDWESQVRAISDQLGVSWPRLNHQARGEVEQFLATRHRHQQFSAAELDEHSAVVPWVRRSYAAFARACETGETPDVETLTEIARQLRQADGSYGPMLATWRGIAAKRGAAVEERGREVERLNRELTAAVEERDGEVERLNRELTAAVEERDGEVERLNRELTAAVEERDGEVERLNRELTAAVEERDGEVERLNRELTATLEATEEIKGELEIRRQEVASVTRELEGRERELEAPKERVAQLTRELEASQEAAKQLTQALQRRGEERDQLSRSLQEREAELESRRLRATRAQREIQLRNEESARQGIEIEHLQSEIERLQKELTGRLAEIERDSGEIERLESDLDLLREQQEELLDAQAQATIDEEQVSGLQRTLEQQARELRSREQQLAEHSRELERLEARAADRDDLTRALAARDEELGRRATALAEADTALAGLRAELDGVAARLAEREASIERMSADAAVQEAREEKLRGELATRAGELSESTREVSALREEAARRAGEAEELISRVDDLSSALERIGSDVEALSSRFAAVRDETALTYLSARPPSRLRVATKLLGWSLRPSRFNDLRSYRTIRRSGRFDSTYYLLRYPEVATGRRHPILDYVESGAREGRDPSASFSTRAYLASHSDLEQSGTNPFAHFLRSGAAPELEAGE